MQVQVFNLDTRTLNPAVEALVDFEAPTLNDAGLSGARLDDVMRYLLLRLLRVEHAVKMVDPQALDAASAAMGLVDGGAA